MKKYLVEFIGAFFFILTIVCVVNGLPKDNYMAPIAIGSALMIMVYAGGHISGGHYNPAVSTGALLRGKLGAGDFPMYIVAQVLGAILASVVASSILEKGSMMGGTGMPENMAGAFVAEMLGTFALVYVVLQTATTKSTAGNSYYGLAIGFTVVVMAYALGGFGTGGCFNPAIAVGIAFNGLISWGTAGLAIAANILGGVLAALFFKAVYTPLDSDD